MTAVLERELQEYFKTMLGYVFIASFLFLAGLWFSVNNIRALNAEFNTTLNDCIYVLLLTAPLLTMRLLAEERKTKREQLLLTSRLSLFSIVVGKFLAAFSVFAITVCLTGVYPLLLFLLGNPSLAQIVNGYVGFLLIGAVFIAVGVFVSALTENQLTAAAGTYGLLLLFVTLDLLVAQVRVGWLTAILQWFSVFRRFKPFQFGSFSVSSAVYYLVFCSAFLFLTGMVMERRRWSTS